MRFLLLFCALVVAAAQDVAVRSAASYGPAVSPDSLAAIFGEGLATQPAVATLDEAGQLPTTLAGVRVTFAGAPARLLFVSAAQINLLVPGNTQLGEIEVEVTTGDGVIQRGSALIERTSPAIFSLDASGTGPGAVLNALTGRGAPFMVETPETPGADKRTRIALFGTGIRHADAVALTAVSGDGQPISLDVEFFGAAPGFFGLDQINAVLRSELDDGGLVSLQLAVGGRMSNVVSIAVTSLEREARPTTPQPVFGHFVTSAQVFTNCAGISGQPSIPCIAFAFDHSWSPSSSPNGIARYELDSALGRQVFLPATETEFTEWRVDFSDLECSPEPVGQTFSWSVRAIDMLGNASDSSRIGVFEIGPCAD